MTNPDWQNHSIFNDVKDILYGLLQANMKRFTRAGLFEFLKEQLEPISDQSRVLIVGGKGPVLDYVLENYSKFTIRTLDVERKHKPDFLTDLSIEEIEMVVSEKFDFVVMLEVLEHIPEYLLALRNCRKLLKEGGKLIGSTPWVIPPHDLPHDYHRFTNFELERALFSAGFADPYIESRGNFVDSLLVLGLRGLKSGGIQGKVIHLLFSILSISLPKARRYSPPSDACIGYNWSAINK